jgi:hypothetical protein
MSAQFLPEDLGVKLAAELGDTADGLATHYHAAAHTLSNLISPREGGIFQVQQLFLSSVSAQDRG